MNVSDCFVYMSLLCRGMRYAVESITSVHVIRGVDPVLKVGGRGTNLYRHMYA